MKVDNKLALLAILLFTSCSQTTQLHDEEPSSIDKLGQPYTDTVNHFSITFPNSWIVKPNYFSTVMAIGYSPNDSFVKNENRGAISLRVTSVSDSMNTSTYYNASLVKIMEDQSLVIIEQGNFDLNGKITKFVVVQKDLGNNIDFITTYLYMVANQKAFSFNGSVDATYRKDFDKHFFDVVNTLEVE